MNWQLQEAKNRLSALVDAAQGGEPQTITRRGRPAVVVIDAALYERLVAGRSGFVDHLLAMPRDDGTDEPFERPEVEPRDLDL